MILAELPFGNRTAKLEVTGADILAALENGVARVEDGAGRFPQVSGIGFDYAAAKPAGSSVGAVTVAGPRSEARRLGQECVITCRTRGSPNHQKNKQNCKQNT